MPYIAKRKQLTEEQNKFAKTVEAFQPDVKPGYCGADIIKDADIVGDQYQYSTVMKNTCSQHTMVFTAYMEAEEWDDVEFYYQSLDEDGNLAYAS